MSGSVVRFGGDSWPAHLIVCFPHAGGSVAPYRAWSLPGVEFGAVCYPGRGRRIAEPCATDLVRLAQGIAWDLHDVELPLALFGHSMGASVALETARALEAAGRPVAHLFASGSRQAPLPRPPSPNSVGNDDEILQSIIEMGGADAALVRDPALADLVLPYLRADAQMFHGYVMAPAPRLPCPITTIVGAQDSHADLRPWADLSHSHREHVVPGGHFYLLDTPPLSLVAARLGSITIESEKPR